MVQLLFNKSIRLFVQREDGQKWRFPPERHTSAFYDYITTYGLYLLKAFDCLKHIHFR